MQNHVQASAPSESTLPNPASYALNFLWLDKNIAVSVDQVFGEVIPPGLAFQHMLQ